MGFKDMKRDDHGHVISNDETDGQKCQHGAGGSSAKNNHSEEYNEISKYSVADKEKALNRLENAYRGGQVTSDEYYELKKKISERKLSDEDSFDDDYEEEFEDKYDRDESIRKGIEYFKDHYSEQEFVSPMSFMEKRMRDWPGDEKSEILEAVNNRKEKKPKFDIDELNRRTMRSAEMSQKVENAKRNGQTPQQVLDSVAYDMDISPDSEEYKNLKDIVMRDTRLNKESGAYEYNKYNIGSNKLLSGDERKKMEALAEEFKKAGLDVELKDTYEDYGADMKITNLISGDTQVLDPKEWMDYMNGNKSAEETVKAVKEGEYSDVFDWREPQQELGEEDIYNKFIDEGDKSYSEHKGNPNWDRAYYRYHHGSSSQMPENYKAGQDFSEDDVVKLSNGEYGKVAQIMPNGDLYVISRSGGKVYKSNEITKEGLLGDYLNSFHGK